MSEAWDFGIESSSRFHRELDLAKLRTFHEKLFDEPGEHFYRLPPEEQAGCRELVAEDARAIDAVIARGSEIPGGAAPCDIVKFTHREAPDRAMTKIGGLPYWPANRPWPANWRGKPLSFLGQINFRDSRDLVGNIPGEILVMFVNEWDWVRSFWIDPTDEPLIDADAVPDYDRKFGTSYGVIHRTHDIPGRTLSEKASVRDGIEASIFDLKIGGAPWGYAAFAPRDGRFLFQWVPAVEEFDDGVVAISSASLVEERLSQRGLLGWRTTQKERTLHWRAAYLLEDGSLEWSWA